MSATIEELTVNYEENDLLTTKELDKVVLSKGAWTTILFRYKNWDNKIQDYGPVRYTIRRYQKREGQYMPKSKFNISSKEQAGKIIDALQKWVDME